MFRLACAAPNCLMRTYDFTKEQSKLVENNYTVSFHKFPRDAEHRQAWIEAAKKPGWNPSLEDSLCSLHFHDDCFDVTSQLYDHAVPTIFFEDFRSYIKNLAKVISLEVDLESSDENEDILSKSLKSIGPLVSEDIDDDQIVECEISLSDDDGSEATLQDTDFNTQEDTNFDAQEDTNFDAPEDININAEQDTNCNANEHISSQPVLEKAAEEKPVTKTENKVESTPPVKSNDKTESTPSTPATATKVQNSTASAKTKNSNNDTMQKLYSLVQDGSLNENEFVEPTSNSFVLQLLNIVKMANLQNASIDSSVPNTYLITTRQENKNPNGPPPKVITMETSEIISLITKTVKMIKKGEFRKSNLLTIICASPAIFLIKNVAVMSFDTNMNSVYVVTSENLIQPLAVLHAQLEKEQTIKLKKQASLKATTGFHKIEGNASAIKNVPPKPPSVNKNATQNPTKNTTVPITDPQPSKPTTPTTPLRPLKPKPPTLTPQNDVNPLKNVKIDLKAIKNNSLIGQSFKNLNLSGVPTLLENVGSSKKNILKLNIATPVPKVLIPDAKSNVLRIDLAAPVAVPKGAVYCADNSNDVNAKVGDRPIKREARDEETGATPAKKPAIDNETYLKNQKREIRRLENNILNQEREIGSLKKKLITLKKRASAIKKPSDTKSDEQIVEDILNKYFDQDAVQFFLSQMKVSGKTYTQFRWSEEDKLFALGLLYKHPVEYNILFQKFTLPSDKTLSKFVSKIKKAERDAKTSK